MRVAICGAGPGGLLLAVLLGRAHHDVTVFERNQPGTTYGFGVVFSEEAQAELRDADYETYLAIDGELVRWDAIDVFYGGERIRSRGHAFSAIERRTLLRVLAERAEAAGARIRYGATVDPARDELDGYDVVVGADGIRSSVRAAYEEHFRPRVDAHRARYVWFGADFALPVFTFIFQPTDYGLFQVHAYPYDAERSTWIVECSEDAWRSAGLDEAGGNKSRAFCEELFAPWLGKRRLLVNADPAAGGRSIWGTFSTLRNRSWHHGRMVLLGDAAHTAHFSIGSGTRLALDDAIALAKAFVAHPGDLRAAFATYEGERQPIVERFQEAASDSSRYFESVTRYVGFAPEQFAFNLLTRSGRITHLELTRRDPALVNRVDRWFAGDGRLTVPAPSLVPLRLAAGTAVPNRLVMAPAEGGDLAAAAGLGAGMVVSGPVAPSPEGRVTTETPGLWSGQGQASWAASADAVHGAGSLLALRLTHAGRRGATRPRRQGVDRPLPHGWPLLAASALPYRPGARVPRAIDDVAMAAVGGAYAAAAARAAAAGIDALVLDMSDGYLLAGFLSPLANQRSDRYGGDLPGRARFPLEIMAAVRQAWPENRALGVRLVADDRAPGGLTPDDGVTLARWVKEAGADFVDVAAGHSVEGVAWAPSYRRLYDVGLADRIRNEAGLPVIVSGHITRIDDVDTIVAAGRADLCVLDPRLYRRDPGGIG